MKNFTLLLVMFLISFGLNAKSTTELQKKMQQKQKKIYEMTQRNAKLNHLLNLSGSEAVLKSAAVKQKLDSTIYQVLNAETQTWQNDYKDEFLYDSEMKNTWLKGKEWNLLNNTWDVVSNIKLEYDNSDRINSILMEEADSLTKLLVFYNPAGMQDSTIWYSTENAGVTWVLDMKLVNNYNASKQLIKTDVLGLNEEGDLTQNMNIVKTYTAFGKLATSSTNIVDGTDEMLMSKIEYNYDGSQRLTSLEYSMVNWFTTGALEKMSRNIYQYNASGKVYVDIYSTWNGTSYIDEDKTLYEFNAAGDVKDEISSKWNGTAWVEDWKDEYTYSTTDFSEVAFPSYDFIMDVFSSFINVFGMMDSNDFSTDFSNNKAITGLNSYEMVNSSWKNTEKTTFYYSGTSTNISELANTLFTVYPNPASEQVNFRWKGNYESLSLEMYQITGAKVLEQVTYSGRPVSISMLENGVYFFKLLNGQQMVHTGKMIKR